MIWPTCNVYFFKQIHREEDSNTSSCRIYLSILGDIHVDSGGRIGVYWETIMNTHSDA